MKNENPKFQISNIEIFFSKIKKVVIIRDFSKKEVFKEFDLVKLNEFAETLFSIGNVGFILPCDNGLITIHKNDKDYVIDMLDQHSKLLKPIS